MWEGCSLYWNKDDLQQVGQFTYGFVLDAPMLWHDLPSEIVEYAASLFFQQGIMNFLNLLDHSHTAKPRLLLGTFIAPSSPPVV